jgi:predicted DNA-binding ribbon-helix-helix protein
MKKAQFTKRTSVALTQQMYDLIESISNLREISLGETIRLIMESGLETIAERDGHDGD